MGQKTGTSKTEKNVMMNAVIVPLVHAYQNLNSGSLLAKGLYSSLSENGKSKSPLDPIESTLSSGSNCGDKKPINWFSK